jgi:hypothetical protein
MQELNIAAIAMRFNKVREALTWARFEHTNANSVTIAEVR